jgi:hypothetical protein
VNYLRSLRDDLVEKRLWPIALLLLLAAIAVPVFLGRGGGGDGAAVVTPPAAAPAGDVAGATPAVQVVGPPSVRARAGAVRDQFRRAAKAKASVATVDGAPAPATSSGGAAAPATKTPRDATSTTPSATTSTTPAAESESNTTTTTPAAAPSATATASVYRTRVRWGTDDSAKARGISRLEPLGGQSDPALLYLGTTDDHAQAMFVLGPNALADAPKDECAEETCRIIVLKAGKSVDVGVVGVDGGADRRYVLTVDAITETVVASEAAAREQGARVHSAGREVLREIIKDPKTAAAIGQFGYAPSLGAVVGITAP